MANYEYHCSKCAKTFTVKQTFQEHDRRPRPKCPKCGSVKVEQVFGSIHVKTSKKS